MECVFRFSNVFYCIHLVETCTGQWCKFLRSYREHEGTSMKLSVSSKEDKQRGWHRTICLFHSFDGFINRTKCPRFIFHVPSSAQQPSGKLGIVCCRRKIGHVRMCAPPSTPYPYYPLKLARKGQGNACGRGVWYTRRHIMNNN